MKSILQIGYHKFLFNSHAAACAAYNAISKAIEVDDNWNQEKGREEFFPLTDPKEISRLKLSSVPDDCILSRDPSKEPDPVEIITPADQRIKRNGRAAQHLLPSTRRELPPGQSILALPAPRS